MKAIRAIQKLTLLVLMLFSFLGFSQNPAELKSGVDIKGVIKADFNGVPKDTVITNIVTWDGSQQKYTDYNTFVDKINTDILTFSEKEVSAEWLTGLTFEVRADRYIINNVVYTSTTDNVTLDVADSSNDRIDLIIAIPPIFPATIGIVGKITGLANPNPAEPDYDPLTAFPIKFVLVKAGDTTASNPNEGDGYGDYFERFIIFEEDLGEPDEWSYITDANSAVVTDEAHTGTKSIRIQSPTSAGIKFTNTTKIQVNLMTTVSFWVKANNPMASVTIKYHTQPYPAGLLVFHVYDGQFGFDGNYFGWQKVTIPDFGKGVDSSKETREIYVTSHSYPIDFYIDDFVYGDDNYIVSTPQDSEHATNTSQLINDGEDGINPFITASDVPIAVSEATVVSAVHLQDLDFQVIADRYPFNGQYVSSTAGEVTLDIADGTNDRIDLIVAVAPISPATVGTVGKITGTPSVNPAEPDYDRELYFPIKFVLVKTGATIPSNPTTRIDIVNTLTFDEQLGGEWVFSSTDGNNNVNTNQAYSGTKSIESINSDAFNYFLLTAPSPVDVSDITALKFWFKANGIIESSNSYINVGLLDNLANTTVHVKNGDFGYDATNTNWQLITIDASLFPMSSNTINQIFIKDVGTSLNTYYVDKIELELYSESIVPVSDIIPPTGLESIDEGNGNGLVKVGRDSYNYGDVGLNAVDLSFSNSVSSTRGATGDESFATNVSTASGPRSLSGGGSESSGHTSTALNETISSGNYSLSSGRGMEAFSGYETALGSYGTTYSPTSQGGWSALDRLLNIGNGTSSGTRSDAFTILKNGFSGFGTNNPYYPVEIMFTDANNTSVSVLGITRESTGTPGIGYGVAMDFNGENSDNLAVIGTIRTSVSPLDDDLYISTRQNGILAERFRLGVDASFTGVVSTDATISEIDTKGSTALITHEYFNPTTNTGTVLDINKVTGTYYNMASANTSITYTTANLVLGSFVKVLINAVSEPTVTGATKVSSPTFVVSTDMYMVAYTNDGTNVEYYFLLK